MAAIEADQIDTDSTDILPISYGDSTTLPDFSVLNVAFHELDKMSNDFFTFENHPRIPFYDTSGDALFSGSCHKAVQIKRRILEYRAKY
jgi:hypothetical protein